MRTAKIKEARGQATDAGSVPSHEERDESLADAKPKKLDDADAQFKILNPEELSLTLEIPDGDGFREKVIKLPTKFTLSDVFHRAVLDDLEAFTKLIIAEIQRLSPDAELTQDWMGEHLAYMEAAMTRSNVRTFTREIVAKVSKTPINEVREGLSSQDATVAALFLMNRFNDEVQARAKKLAASKKVAAD